ncbi:hypothetical protein DMENIID0001_092970 [Sergentomyia squamirostris]
MSVARRNSQDLDVSMKRKHQTDEGFSEVYEKPPKFYITLAKESPRESMDSDDATYDSFHGRETDICRDTTDTDSDGTSGDETIAVLEYEVATDYSSPNDNLYSDESSSGTEHEMVIAALTTWSTDDSLSGSDFAIFADTETSDGSATDPELRRADYWECVKCKNKQNNPLYRYCEKCYQIRKNHFPPRPKRRKKRTKRKTKDQRSSLNRELRLRSRPVMTSDEEDDMAEGVGMMKRKESNRSKGQDGKNSVKGRRLGPLSCAPSTRMVTNSAGETPESCEDEVVASTTVGGGRLRNGVTRSRVNSASSSNDKAGEMEDSSLIDRKRRSSRVSRDLLDDDDEEEGEENGAVMPKKAKLDSRFDNKFFKNVIEHLGPSQDSGVHSCASSQELSPTTSLTTILTPQDSQQTYCDELEFEREKTLNSQKDDWVEKVEPNLGLCIMCLEEPKNGVFVHSNFLHLCCCYKCAVKVWKKQKRCPICNAKVNNVLKLFVH